MKSSFSFAVFCLFCTSVAFFGLLSNGDITSCNDVYNKYHQSNYPVFDCYDDVVNNFTYWRIDRKLQWIDAREACRGAGNNADIATIHTFMDQKILNDLYTAKYTLNTWMWIGMSRNANTDNLMWVDGTNVTQLYRFYPYADSRSKNCAIMLILSDPNGQSDVAGTFWYTENCTYAYIAACKANDTAAGQ